MAGARDDNLYEFPPTRAGTEDNGRYVLHLFIAGSSPRSQRAVARIRRLCEEELTDRFELQVVDIFQQPQLAKDEQIVAVPVLIKRLPKPVRVFVGDMADTKGILAGLSC